MGRPIRDLSGQKFSRWTVLTFAGIDHRGKASWHCICEDKTEKILRGNDLVSGKTKSCGCFNREQKTTHGLTESRAYYTWRAMRGRCLNKDGRDYAYYGGRGITICERWAEFVNFLEDIGHPDEGMTLERVDNNGPYSTENCCWATRKEQGHNQRSNVVIAWHDQRLTLDQWAEQLGMKYSMLYSRLARGMSVEEAFTRPRGRWIRS